MYHGGVLSAENQEAMFILVALHWRRLRLLLHLLRGLTLFLRCWRLVFLLAILLHLIGDDSPHVMATWQLKGGDHLGSDASLGGARTKTINDQ